MVCIICNFFTWSSEPLWKLPTIGWSAETWVGHLESSSAEDRQDFLLKGRFFSVIIMNQNFYHDCFCDIVKSMRSALCVSGDKYLLNATEMKKVFCWGWFKSLLSDIECVQILEIVQTRFAVQGFHPNLKF